MRAEQTGNAVLVAGGTVVLPDGSRPADVLVADGRISEIRRPGVGDRPAAVVDASGCLVLPGGVDPHSHIMSDVPSATRAAVLGGTTTVLTFSNPERDEGALDCIVRRRQELAATPLFADVGLHAMLYLPDTFSTAELRGLRELGVAGVKVFLAYGELGIMWSTGGLFRLMGALAGSSQPIQVHCEEGEVIDALVQDAIAGGRTGARVFADTRPSASESSAVARVLALSEIAGARCYLTHLSCAGSLGEVRQARTRPRPPFDAEVCLHHLVADESSYERPDADRFLVAPPLRSRADVEALWGALAEGTVQVVASDHAQSKSTTIPEIDPSHGGYGYGIAGIGPRLALLLSLGRERGFSFELLSQLGASNAARAFGLFPRKGVVAPGADADLVVYDPAAETTLASDTYDDRTGDSIYAGMRLAGAIRDVFLRGEQVVRNGEYCSPEAVGAYLPATHSDAH